MLVELPQATSGYGSSQAASRSRVEILVVKLEQCSNWTKPGKAAAKNLVQEAFLSFWKPTVVLMVLAKHTVVEVVEKPW